MNMSVLKSHSHGMYGMQYDLLLATDGRKPLLKPRARKQLEVLIGERVEAWEGDLLDLTIEPDFVRLSVSLPPTAAVAEFVQALKTGTSRRLRNSFAGLRRHKRLWATSYGVVTGEGAQPGALESYLGALSG